MSLCLTYAIVPLLLLHFVHSAAPASKPKPYNLKCFELGAVSKSQLCSTRCKAYGFGPTGDRDYGGYGCCCGAAPNPIPPPPLPPKPETYVEGGKKCFQLGLLCTTQACDYRCQAYGFGTAGGCNKEGYGCCCFNKPTTKAPTAPLPPKPKTYQLKCFEAGLLCTDVFCQNKCKEYGYDNEGDCNRGGYGCCCGKGAKPKRVSPV